MLIDRLAGSFGYTVMRVPPSYGIDTPVTIATRRQRVKSDVRRALKSRGRVVRRPYPSDFTPELIQICERTSGYTTSPRDRIAALHLAVEHLDRVHIPGAIAETGVWRGGSMMIAALTLLNLGSTERDLYLFDTFAGMPEPGDVDTSGGTSALPIWREHPDWMMASEPDVRRAMLSTGYPEERVHLVRGMVEETIPLQAPEQIALLRIDTDWYSSVKHSLESLYPRLQPGGILILDDYGAWDGARKAVDEFFNGSVFLQRIDYTARLVVKT
jgi:O-methyltransferase